MEQVKQPSRRDRNREAATKYRNKVKSENDELQRLYASNENKIAHLENMVDTLSEELSRSRRR